MVVEGEDEGGGDLEMGAVRRKKLPGIEETFYALESYDSQPLRESFA